MENNAQLLKGVLEYCVLKLIAQEPTYGYEIVMHLKQVGFSDLSERKHTLSAAIALGAAGKGYGRAQTFSQGTEPKILHCNGRRTAGAS